MNYFEKWTSATGKPPGRSGAEFSLSNKLTLCPDLSIKSAIMNLNELDQMMSISHNKDMFLYLRDQLWIVNDILTQYHS